MNKIENVYLDISVTLAVNNLFKCVWTTTSKKKQTDVMFLDSDITLTIKSGSFYYFRLLVFSCEGYSSKNHNQMTD